MDGTAGRVDDGGRVAPWIVLVVAASSGGRDYGGDLSKSLVCRKRTKKNGRFVFGCFFKRRKFEELIHG